MWGCGGVWGVYEGVGQCSVCVVCGMGVCVGDVIVCGGCRGVGGVGGYRVVWCVMVWERM